MCISAAKCFRIVGQAIDIQLPAFFPLRIGHRRAQLVSEDNSAPEPGKETETNEFLVVKEPCSRHVNSFGADAKRMPAGTASGVPRTLYDYYC